MRFPVFSCPMVIRGGRAVCRLPGRVVSVEAPAALLSALVPLCDGDTPLAKIRSTLAVAWRSAQVDRLLRALEQAHVLVDVERVALEAWRHVENPGHDPEPLAPRVLERLVASGAADRTGAGAFGRPGPFGLRRTLEARQSTRRFAARPVPLSKIRSILWACYGAFARGAERHRTVPSGGALFPLQIHLVNLRPAGALRAGVYAVRFRPDGAVGLARVASEARNVYRAYLDPDTVRSAQGVVLISGRFGLSARKYGNRALLLVTLEAGHAAQNALLAAAQLGLGAVEIGGFIEEQLRRLTGTAPDATPLTSIVFGSRERAAPRAPAEAPEFGWIDLEQAGFHLGSAKFPEWRDDGDLCWGRDADPLLAHDKAIAEAWERRGCEQPRGLRNARGVDMRAALDPASVIAYLPGQYRQRGFPFKPYSSRRDYAWKEGRDYETGKAIPVLAECVYHPRGLPAKLRARAYTAATSSGVAAYTDAEQAFRRAVLELVERDAFMTAWLGRRPAPAIAPRSMPPSVQRRLAVLRQAGFRVVARDLSRDLAPVVLLFAQHPGRGFTSVATHADFDPTRALEHALTELEAMLFVKLEADRPEPIVPRGVRSALDHAALYSLRRWHRRADQLARMEGSVALRDAARRAARRWEGLVDRLLAGYGRMVCVDITPEGASLEAGRRPLRVVRALVPGLLPLTFGFGCEPLGLARAAALLGEAKIASLSGGKSTLFPHPFA